VDPTWAAARNKSAIEKKPITGSVAVTTLGVEGDEQAADFHGGALQAVYAYAREDLDWWSRRLGRPLRDGMFGENIDLTGFDVNGAALAERWRSGEVLFEVTAPRMACGTFGAWMGEKAWGKRFNATRRPGAYLRVLEEGRLAPGDSIQVVRRPEQKVTVAESVSAVLGDQDVLRRIVTLAEAVPDWDPAAMMYHINRRAKSAGTQKSTQAGTQTSKQTGMQASMQK
jgi:MOSC domain-containing protein YiiM